jgi:hypothetical protein
MTPAIISTAIMTMETATLPPLVIARRVIEATPYVMKSVIQQSACMTTMIALILLVNAQVHVHLSI